MIWNILEVNFLKISVSLIIDCIKRFEIFGQKPFEFLHSVLNFKQFIFSFQLSIQTVQLHIFLGHSDDHCYILRES